MAAKPKITPLVVRKLADKSEGERIHKYDPDTGARKLVNPDTPGDDHEPWPFAGLAIEGEAPRHTRVSTAWVTFGKTEGWLELEGERVEHKPGGPQADPWATTHTFVHADVIVLKTVDGDVHYRVLRQPDKYDGGPENGTGKPTDAAGDRETSVDWFYDLELVG
jgi:hypothetical protein